MPLDDLVALMDWVLVEHPFVDVPAVGIFNRLAEGDRLTQVEFTTGGFDLAVEVFPAHPELVGIEGQLEPTWKAIEKNSITPSLSSPWVR